ncbi:hypothetical protein PIROE2DRAFT_12256 [Piromyces sp. E2]|nr:hypothetical protein PIROE2DRAFT_12256 [Piromyces sp. E2]|eukprot:OUM61665.1 hypothetical protein PIROE2DRAFT_12256 [Piromyces sp. E2]
MIFIIEGSSPPVGIIPIINNSFFCTIFIRMNYCYRYLKFCIGVNFPINFTTNTKVNIITGPCPYYIIKI